MNGRRRSPRSPVLKRDHARPRTAPAPTTAELDAHLQALLGPAVTTGQAAARALGLRDRVLTVPVMVAAVVTLIWRQVPSITELARVLAHQDVLWAGRCTVSQQALSQRLRCLPASLFATILDELLPRLHARAAARTRPRPALPSRLLTHYPHLWTVDGTTLEEVFRKVGLLRGTQAPVAGGKLLAVLDVVTRLPVALWLDDDATANDLRFQERLLARLVEPTLLIADAQFFSFPLWDALTEAHHAILCRARQTFVVDRVDQVLCTTPHVRDRVIRLGVHPKHPCRYPVRLIEIRRGERWDRYITTILDPALLGPVEVVDLYGRRWRIEEAFLQTKRLLGLSYLWSGAFNAIALQVWATWLLYAVLVDLTDAVADELDQPLDALSMEMVYRGLYHYAVAASQGEARDPVAYLAAHPELGLVKRRRPKRERAQAARNAWRQELNL